MSRVAYLSVPRGIHTFWYSRRLQIETALQQMGYDVYRTDGAFQSGPGSSGVVRVDRAVLSSVQVGVVLIPDLHSPLLEVQARVEELLRRRVPTLVVTDVGDSPQIDEWKSRGVQVCASEIDAIDQALPELVQQDRSRPDTAIYRTLQSMQNMTRTLASTGRKPELTFEPVEAGHEYVLTTTGPQCLLPTRGYADDAGLDLYVSADVTIGPHEFVDVPAGVKVDIPDGCWAMITGRSSTLRKRGLLVSTGVIDAGWTGGLFAGVQNLTDQDVMIDAGDRLAQLILLPAPVVGYEPDWGRVPEKTRGERGFGSTGS